MIYFRGLIIWAFDWYFARRRKTLNTKRICSFFSPLLLRWHLQMKCRIACDLWLVTVIWRYFAGNLFGLETSFVFIRWLNDYIFTRDQVHLSFDIDQNNVYLKTWWIKSDKKPTNELELNDGWKARDVEEEEKKLGTKRTQ